MNKKTLVGGIIVVAIIIAGVITWFAIKGGSNTTGDQSQTSGNTNASSATDVTDMTTSKQADVVMTDLSFKPAKIKIKKGTTVTWTNNDTVAHNVVAADSSNTGGLPTSAATFGRGGTFSFTFNQTGTFEYLCQPHKSIMHGEVQVVD